MDKFHDNSNQFDPYKNFRFRLQMKKGSDEDFVDVMGVSKISGLKKTVEIIEHREGGDSSTSTKSPGSTRYEAVTLERCITQDQDFETWCKKIITHDNDPDTEISSTDFKKDIRLIAHNETDQEIMAYNLYGCWVSEYQPTPDFDSNENTILIEHIKLQCERWERITNIQAKTEPEL